MFQTIRPFFLWLSLWQECWSETTRLTNFYVCNSPFSLSSFPLLSKKPVVRAFLLSKGALLLGLVATALLPSDSEKEEKIWRMKERSKFTAIVERRYFYDASVKYEGEILVACCGPVVVSSIRFRLYTEMEQRNVERTRGNGTRWNAIPPWSLSNVNDHTGVYREKLVYHITKRTEYFLNNVHRTCNRFWLINKSLKYSILLIKHHSSCRTISYRFKFHLM